MLQATTAPPLMALVIQGRAVHFLAANSGLGDEIDTALALPGVSVVACENSLRAVGLSVHDLDTGVSSTPAAVVFLAQSQLEGWAYVRI